MKEYSCRFEVLFAVSAKNHEQATERAEEIMDAIALPEKKCPRYFPDEIEKLDLQVSDYE